jgi:transposase-like protein
MTGHCWQFSPRFKFDVAMQLLRGEKRIGELCREHQLKDSLVYGWRDELLERGLQVYSGVATRSTTNGGNA